MPNQTKPKYDLLFSGAISGIAAVIVKDLLEILVVLFMPTFNTCPQLAAGIIFSPQKVKSSIFPLVGFEIDLAVSIVVGIIIALALARIGFAYWKFKGIIVGLLAWAIIDMTLAKYLSNFPPPNSLPAIEISLIIHFFYGLTVVKVLQKCLNSAESNKDK